MTSEKVTVGSLMTPLPVTVRADATVGDADEEMHRSDFRHLPVIDDRGHLVGVLSQRDLVPHLRTSAGRATELAKIMVRDVLTVRPDTPAREASLLLLEHKIGALVVVDGDAQLVGMITETDFLRFAHEVLGGDALAVDEA
jgi:CBS domain-containing membrane protein